MIIRRLRESDWPAVWTILKPVFRAGETYVYDRDISRDEAHQEWVAKPEAAFVAEDEVREIIGTYYIKPNQPGQGRHVCNCGYVVAEAARGQGVASAMCEHSQEEAVARGYRAMQYNLVVATNTGAIRLWQKHGFEVVGTLPEAFHQPVAGYVDALVMYKRLVGEDV